MIACCKIPKKGFTHVSRFLINVLFLPEILGNHGEIKDFTQFRKGEIKDFTQFRKGEIKHFTKFRKSLRTCQLQSFYANSESIFLFCFIYSLPIQWIWIDRIFSHINIWTIHLKSFFVIASRNVFALCIFYQFSHSEFIHDISVFVIP